MAPGAQSVSELEGDALQEVARLGVDDVEDLAGAVLAVGVVVVARLADVALLFVLVDHKGLKRCC